MPGAAKESVKDRKARERREQIAQQQHAERQTLEIDEEKARQVVELEERCARAEALVSFYSHMIDPAARMVVMQTTHDAMMGRLQQKVNAGAARVLAVQESFEDMQAAHGTIQLELAHIRADTRRLAAAVRDEIVLMRHNVSQALQGTQQSIMEKILERRLDAQECGQHLNRALEENMVKLLDMARRCETAALRLTSVQQEATSLHTRLPQRVRTSLRQLEPDELLLILDTLSFEDSALEYILCRYPPPPDDPFLNPEPLPRQAQAVASPSFPTATSS